MISSLSARKLWQRPEVLRILFIALLAETGYAVLNISAMPIYLKFDRHYSAIIIGFVFTGYLLSEASFKGVMGELADRIGRKRLMTFGPALTIFTSLLTLYIPESIGVWAIFLIILLRIIDGIGASMLWPAAFALMGDTVDEAESQQAMSLLNVCYFLGVALALPLGGILDDLLGTIHASFYLTSLLFLAVFITGVRLLPADYLGKHHKHLAQVDQLSGLWNSFKKIPEFLILAFFTFMAIGFPMAIIKIFAEQQLNMSESAFGLLVLPGAVAMAASSVPMSKLGEQMGQSKAVHRGMALSVLGLGIISLGAFFPFARHYLFLAIGAIPVGVGFLLAIPAWYTGVSAIDPTRRAANIGAVMTAQGIGAILGAPLGAFFYERFQVYGVVFGHYSPFLGCLACLTISWLLSLKILHV